VRITWLRNLGPTLVVRTASPGAAPWAPPGHEGRPGVRTRYYSLPMLLLYAGLWRSPVLLGDWVPA